MFCRLKDGEPNFLRPGFPAPRSCFSWWSYFPRVVSSHQGFSPMFSSVLVSNKFEVQRCTLPSLSSYFPVLTTLLSFFCFLRSFRLSRLSFAWAPSSTLLFSTSRSTHEDWGAGLSCFCREKSFLSVIRKQQQSRVFSQDRQYPQLLPALPQWSAQSQTLPHSWTSPFLGNVDSPI